MKLRVIEAFSGIGAQAKALKKIKKNNPNFDYEIVATVEWEIGAMYAYDIIHHGKQDLAQYDKISKEELISKLEKYNLSSDGKTPLKKGSLSRMKRDQLKAICHSIGKNKNLVDISTVHAQDLPEADLLTYSFPCQDLSISSYWHKNFSGIDKGTNNRSSLLWQIERILKEYQEIGKKKPRFLLMENVTAIKSPRHLDNFELWKQELRKLGYESYSNLDLNAKNFGVPQNRIRTFMLSVLVEDNWNEIHNYLEQSKLHQVVREPELAPFLRLDYKDKKYLDEAIESTPNYTDSRKKIYKDSTILATGLKTSGNIAKTITTKQDRNPNAGLIEHELQLGGNKAPYRNLTPRETFLLMGFDESDFDLLISNNIAISKSERFLSRTKLLKLTGNSIVVNVLEQIFMEVHELNKRFFAHDNVVPFKHRRILVV
jgi:DNA (cytosine-5)-methyltransferase 1